MQKNYVEMSLIEFVKRYPSYLELCAPMLSDSEYIVRIDRRRGLVEFGYSSDDWNIK